jgi:AhpD family alkylhydroperoxidase
MARKLSEKEIEESKRTYVSTLGKEPSWFDYVANNMGETLRGFDIMRKGVYSDGALSKKTKQLLFVAMNLILRNEQGLALHVNVAKKFGATDEEIAETLETVAMFGASLPLSKIGLIAADLKR